MQARIDAREARPELVVERVLEAPRALVFAVWTRPEHAVRWWGPQGFETVSLAMDVREGGAWRRVLRAPDGALYVKHGVYREIVPPERLVFTYVNDDAEGRAGPTTLVTVTLAEEGARTRLRLHHTLFETRQDRDDHQGGWTSAARRMADYLAGLHPPRMTP